jgi:hypothetical protein
VLPDGVQFMVDDDPKLLDLVVCLWALRHHPHSSASACHQVLGGGQHNNAQPPCQTERTGVKEKCFPWRRYDG